MKTILAALGVSICSVVIAVAQTDEDALRFSQTPQPFGTARSVGAGSAFGAIGADFSALTINPAGIAVYRTNELTITPGLTAVNTSTDFIGGTNEARKYNLNLSNVGLVFSWLKDPAALQNTSKWASFSFGFGATRLASFHQDVYYKGLNTSNSLVNSYLDRVQNMTPANVNESDPFGYSMFWQTGLIQQKPGTSGYGSILENGGLDQSKTFTTRGGITDYNLTFGGNYDNKLMLGIGIGIPSLRYLYESTYTENDTRDSIPNFNRFDYNYELRTTGIGINGRLGLIYKAHEAVRLGVSVQSPTYFSMHDTWESGLRVNYNSGTIDTVPPFTDGRFNYALVTPWKFTGSAGFVIGSHGFVGVDYEWQDFSEASFVFNTSASTADKEYAAAQNNLINQKYTGAGTLRLGGELALNIFRLRAGYALGATPFKSGVGVSGFDQKRNALSAGFGFMEESFFIDFAFRRVMSPGFEQPYFTSVGEVPGARMTTKANHFVLTAGFKF